MKPTIALFLMTFFVCPALDGSSNYLEEDRCMLHLNKTFYVSGEVIWYKLYCPASFTGQNIAIRVDVWNKEAQLFSSVFHKTEGKAAVQGYYQIPFDLPSGMYHLVFSSLNAQTASRVKLAEGLIPIYNDLDRKAPSADEIGEELQTESFYALFSELQVNVSLSDTLVHRRASINTNISVKDQDGKPVSAALSVSVRDLPLTGNHQPIIKGEQITANLATSLDSNIVLQGRLTDSLGQSLHAVLFGAYAVSEQRFIYTQSNTQGQFSLAMPDFYGNQSIQFLDYQYDDIQVDFQMGIPLEKEGALVYTPAVLAYLNASRQRKKIYQLYNTFEHPIEAEAVENDPQELEPDNFYLVQDYESFPSIPVFFKELVTPLKFRNEDGKLVAKIFNPQDRIRSFYPGAPVFIVNGHLTRDPEFIAELDISQVQRVDIYHQKEKLRQLFGPLGNNGVVIIETEQANIPFPPLEADDVFSVHGLQASCVFPGAAFDEIPKHHPYLHPQLYWNSKLQTNDQGELSLEFLQSDDLSRYQIEVFAQSKNGKRGIGRATYQVQPEK